MAIQILGVYLTEEEAINAVDAHALAGLREENITLLANEKHANAMENRVHVTIISSQPKKHDGTKGGFASKVKKVFSNDSNTNLHSEPYLQAADLSEGDVAECLNAIEEGKIVAIADGDIRMGHDIDRIGQ